MDTADDGFADDHMRLLEWLDAHPTDTLTAAAQVLGMDVGQVEVLSVDLIAAGMVERARRQ